MTTKTIIVSLEKLPEGFHFTFAPESTGFHPGDILEFLLSDDTDDGIRFAPQDPWFLAPENPADSVSLTRGGDGRSVEVRILGPVSSAVRSYAYHVNVEVAGRVYRSDGYPTVNQHPPIGGGG